MTTDKRDASATVPDLDALPGVAEAVSAARDAITAVRHLPGNRRDWPRTAAAASIRTARASAMIDGASGVVVPSDAAPQDAGALMDSPAQPVTDPILAGALRVAAAVAELSVVWQRAPLQALARLHTLAAADLTSTEHLGRPRDGTVAGRLTALAGIATRSAWSAPVLAAVVHGELLTLRAFDSANGVVARGAARLVMVSSGLDPQALTAPDVGFLAMRDDYDALARGFATGRADDVAAWLIGVARALTVGAKEARSITVAASGGTTPALDEERHHHRPLV